MAERPGQSLPKQNSSWSELKSAYRLLSNDAIEPEALLEPHQRWVRQRMAGQAVVLCLQDDRHLFTRCGEQVEHASLAVLPDGTVLGVVGVRLLNLRDEAESNRCDEASALREQTPAMWIQIVGKLAKQPATSLTPRQFWLAIARRGGFLARKRDGRPGWKVIWRGWYDIHQMVLGAELWQEMQRCR